MIKKITDFCFPFVALFLCHTIIYSQIRVEAPQQPNSTTEITIKNTPPAQKPADSSSSTTQTDAEIAGVKVKLYYFREATKIVALLEEIKKLKTADLGSLIIKNPSEEEIILFGPESQRDRARRIIVTLDLPRPGISMDMWGVQITSRKPEELAKAMIKVRGIIDQTQQDIRETFGRLQILTRSVLNKKETAVNAEFKKVLEDELNFKLALNTDRPLSFTDILLLMISSKEPEQAAVVIANGLTKFGREVQNRMKIENDKEFRKALPEKPPVPFARFFESRGLEFREKVKDKDEEWVVTNNTTRIRALQSQIAISEFALQYGRLVHEPDDFSPYYLQQSSETVNTRLQLAVDALNADLQELFVIPTLIQIQKAVREFDGVEFAQVGKTRVATISGTATDVSSTTVSTFEERPPMKLSDLLAKADALTKQVTPFDPAKNVVGALPLPQVIGLIGAFGEEKSVWRELNAGISISVTPNVLRNMNSAELKLEIKTSDPGNGTTDTSVPPLSRIGQQSVKTSVYVNALDFFDISSFNNESTLGGRRGYVPVIGPIWRGLFYDIPVFGRLFSWKRDPQTVHHESLILTTSFITPTVMGVAILYPTRDDKEEESATITNLSETDRKKARKEEVQKKKRAVNDFSQRTRDEISKLQ